MEVLEGVAPILWDYNNTYYADADGKRGLRV